MQVPLSQKASCTDQNEDLSFAKRPKPKSAKREIKQDEKKKKYRNRKMHATPPTRAPSRAGAGANPNPKASVHRFVVDLVVFEIEVRPEG